jgi:cytochrome P450
VFGGGRHLCPGRFFANNELKLAIAHVLVKYEMRIANGYEPIVVRVGVYKVVDPVVPLEVRRREGEAADKI